MLCTVLHSFQEVGSKITSLQCVIQSCLVLQRKHDEREAKYQKLRDNMSKVMVRGQAGKLAHLSWNCSPTWQQCLHGGVYLPCVNRMPGGVMLGSLGLHVCCC